MIRLIQYLLVLIVSSSSAQIVHSKKTFMLGSPFEMTVVATDTIQANQYINQAIEEVKRIEHLISDWIPTTQISKVNQNAGIAPVKVDQEVFELIERAIKISKLTNGAFDISYGSLDKSLWNFDKTMTSLPDPQTAKKMIHLIDYRNIILDRENTTVFLKEKGMRIGFGGIGKGYAVDEALKTLKMQGVKKGMISAGSSITVSKAPPSKKGWSVAADTIFFSNGAKRYIENRSQSVSGDDQQYLEWEGKRYSHLLNPLTGKPLSNGATCLVEGPNGLITDALGTAFSIMDFDEIRKVLRWRKSIRVLCKRDDNFFKANWH